MQSYVAKSLNLKTFEENALVCTMSNGYPVFALVLSQVDKKEIPGYNLRVIDQAVIEKLGFSDIWISSDSIMLAEEA